jgi:DNA-binding NarL/FixJ family response regulator
VRWVTRTEQEEDMQIHGTHTRGSRNGAAKFTDEQVDDIRRRLAAGEQGKDIAADLGVSKSTISYIKRGVRYR